MFDSVVVDEITIGYQALLPKHLVFFGTASGSEDIVRSYFSQLDFYFVKQVHGASIVMSSADLVEADGHFTAELNKALAIRTADCLPVMITGEGVAVAVHAGWRGLVGGILPKAVDLISQKSPPSTSARAFVGPHISAESFEVGADVGRQIESCFRPLVEAGRSLLFPHPSGSEKFYADLYSLAQAQLTTAGLTKHNVYSFGSDTLTSTEYHSYRRDNNEAGRQISFVARILD